MSSRKSPNFPWTSAVPTWCWFKAGNWSGLLVHRCQWLQSLFGFLFFPLPDMCQRIKAGYRSITSFCRLVSVWLRASDIQGFWGSECWQSNSAPLLPGAIAGSLDTAIALSFPTPPPPSFSRPPRYHLACPPPFTVSPRGNAVPGVSWRASGAWASSVPDERSIRSFLLFKKGTIRALFSHARMLSLDRKPLERFRSLIR